MSRAFNKYGAGVLRQSGAVREATKLTVVKTELVASALDMKHGKAVNVEADSALAAMLGNMVLRWWFEGHRSTYNGKPFDWCITTQVVEGQTMKGDLRVLMGQSMAQTKVHGLLHIIGVIKGDPVLFVDPATLTIDHLVAIGAAVREWFGSTVYQPLVVSFDVKREGLGTTNKRIERIDVRVLVRTALQGFANALRLQVESQGLVSVGG